MNVSECTALLGLLMQLVNVGSFQKHNSFYHSKRQLSLECRTHHLEGIAGAEKKEKIRSVSDKLGRGLALRGGGRVGHQIDEFPEDFDYGLDNSSQSKPVAELNINEKKEVKPPGIAQNRVKDEMQLSQDKSRNILNISRRSRELKSAPVSKNLNQHSHVSSSLFSILFGALVGSCISFCWHFKYSNRENRNEVKSNQENDTRDVKSFLLNSKIMRELENLRELQRDAEIALEKASEAEIEAEKRMYEAVEEARVEGRQEGAEKARQDVAKIWAQLEAAENELNRVNASMEHEVMNAEIQAIQKFEIDASAREEYIANLEHEVNTLQAELVSMQNEVHRLHIEGEKVAAARDQDRADLRAELEERVTAEKRRQSIMAEKQIAEIKLQLRRRVEQAEARRRNDKERSRNPMQDIDKETVINSTQ